MTSLLSLLVALLLLLTVPGAAVAQTPNTNAPSGNSAIDEYLETVPGASGNHKPRRPAAGDDSGAGALTPAQRARLEQSGADGKALADVVDASAPARATPKQNSTPAPISTQGRSPVREVVVAATGQGGGGMGTVLPAILLASLLGAIALVLMRRRSARSAP